MEVGVSLLAMVVVALLEMVVVETFLNKKRTTVSNFRWEAWSVVTHKIFTNLNAFSDCDGGEWVWI